MKEIIQYLPSVQGTYEYNKPLSEITWLKVGGPADVIFKPQDKEDLQNFLACLDTCVPVWIIGNGSNLIIRDGGLRGVVIDLKSASFQNILCDRLRIRSGAGTLNSSFSNTARKAGIAGFEHLIGIPGTLGGALRMNAGTPTQETKDHLIYAEAVNRKGQLKRFSASELNHDYRKCTLPSEWIFINAEFEGYADDPQIILERMKTHQQHRFKVQETHNTAGSTFKNPKPLSAWKLIEDAGLKGLRHGKIRVSQKHTNFLVNLGGGSGNDAESLGELVRKKVFENSGIMLEWEVIRIGDTKRIRK